LQNQTQEVHSRRNTEPRPPWIGAVGLAIAVGAAYFFAAELSISLLAKSEGVAIFWLAGGVSTGVLIARGQHARLQVAIGTMIATIIASLMGNRNIWISIALALCNAGEVLLAAWLIKRYFSWPFTLDTLRNVIGLLIAAAVATAVGAIGGTVAYKLFHSPTAPIWSMWQHWFASGSVGVITVAPLLIGLAEALRTPPRRNEIIEGVVALGALAMMTVIIASVPPKPWDPFASVAVLFPILFWLAARCQPVFVAGAALIVSLTVVWMMALGIGDFGDPALPIGDRILGAQAAILGFTLFAYVLAALFAERRRAEARLQEALAAGAVMAFECNPLSGLTRRSDNAARILGLDPQQIFTASQFSARIHPDDCARVKAHRYRVRAEGRTDAVTFRFIRPDGHQVWLEETARAEFDTTGRLICIRGLTRDVTSRKHAEERQAQLIAELDHRVKNVLARVAAIVMQTRQSCRTVDEFVRVLHGRVQSMAAAHALLSQSRWSDVGLTEVIRHQLAPYTTDANTTIRGPEIMLTSVQTQAVAMVIHELVTNAAKHGALSNSDGRVSVSWDRTSANTAAVLTIIWSEFGGPPIAAPVRLGYGSSLIRNLVPHELGGAVDLKFLTEGACCKIEFPL
jgi:PAS domain S-box-containing protein